MTVGYKVLEPEQDVYNIKVDKNMTKHARRISTTAAVS